MANVLKRVSQNVGGDFYVDSTCIDCAACRQIAPSVFGQAATTSFVHAQPVEPTDRRQALRALLTCPTGSIGCVGTDDPKPVMADFPLLIEDPVYFCGFNSPKSFGGNSYFVQHPQGNWLIDSPKFISPLVRRLEALGGVSQIFLTHRDDVADADRFARHFGAQRIIHRLELSSQPDAERVIDGDAAIELAAGFVAIPTPGHTAGHCCLLFNDHFLLTGDHLDWDTHEQRLDASREYCWQSWARQRESIRRLMDFRFQWVLPGHGQRVHLPVDQMQQALAELVNRIDEGNR